MFSQKNKPNKLNGTWKPLQQEMSGNSIPELLLLRQSLVMADSNYTYTAESVDKGIIKIKGDKMDIYGREGVNKGKHFSAIFKLEKGLLTICYNLEGGIYPTSYDTKGKNKYLLSVFKKVN